MLTIHVDASPEKEYWDAKKEEFVKIGACKECTLKLEHSLISISLWESKYHIPFISDKAHTEEQTLYYIKCMTINKNVVPDSVYDHLTSKDISKISEYIKDPMTATTVSELPSSKKKNTKEIVTSELIYYWMIALQIPHEYEKWHLNRLLMLIEVCNAKNTPPKKMSKGEIMARNKQLNAARRAKYHTKG